jgi:DDE superfamily endonuclease
MDTQWLPSSLFVWITVLAGALDARQQTRFVTLFTGLLLARGRRTVTSWLRACGVGRDYKRYYDLLGSVGRKTTVIAARMLRILQDRLPPDRQGTPLVLAIDDSPTKRFGPQVEGAGKHHNPTPGPAGSPFLYGHVWVCLARLVRHPRWGTIALPILSLLYIRAKDLGWIGAYYRWQFRTKLELAAAQFEWLIQQLGTDHPPIWVVTDGAYAKRPFLKRVLAAGATVISRLRCDAALWSLPLVVDPDQRGRGRPRIYGKERIDLAKRAGQKRGWQSGRFSLYGRRMAKKYKDLAGDLQAGRRGDPGGAGARAGERGGLLLDRPGAERGGDPGDGGRPLGPGAGLPRRQGGSWSGSATIAAPVGQCGSVEPDQLVAYVGGVVGVGPAADAVVRPERLAVGQEGAAPVARQSLSGVTSPGDERGIFTSPLGGGLAPENPPVHPAPHAQSRVRLGVLEKCRPA